jgi:glucokinase
VTALATEAFGRPAVLENDATAAAAGEHRYGAGRGTRDMVYLTVSTGIGGGVIADGRVYRGSTGNGGELGHVTVDRHGRECRGCGRRGCLEAYASGTSIAERAREAGVAAETATDVAAAARAGDDLAARVWDETCEALASGVTSLVNAFDPEVVVIGGGVSREGEHLLGPVREQVHAQAMGGARVGVVRAELGDAVGVVGAAAVAFERLA